MIFQGQDFRVIPGFESTRIMERTRWYQSKVQAIFKQPWLRESSYEFAMLKLYCLEADEPWITSYVEIKNTHETKLNEEICS